MSDLIERLRLHADLHAELTDPEQQQWADDLREAATQLARLREHMSMMQQHAAPPAQPAAHVDYPCRTDGRCQYAIESGAEGMGHCPKGKCVMAQPAQAQPARLSDERIEEVITAGVKSGEIFWLGYKKDANGSYTLPSLSPVHYQIAHAIAAAVVPPGFVVVSAEALREVIAEAHDASLDDDGSGCRVLLHEAMSMLAAAKATK